jgi:hypothetical protein
LVVFSFVMFWLVESLIPGDYFTEFRLGMTAQDVDALRETFGVDQPIHVRWWRWLVGFMDGGLSFSKRVFLWLGWDLIGSGRVPFSHPENVVKGIQETSIPCISI